ncbi:hypothetical protein ACHAXR_005899 [Thalassiosira sp. AJA248-18]
MPCIYFYPLSRLFRGEHKQQYSNSFRQWEFLSALSAVIADKGYVDKGGLLGSLRERAKFVNAFHYDPYKRNRKLPSSLNLGHVEMYNQALQVFTIDSSDSGIGCNGVTLEDIARATERCSLIHTSYEVVADGASYPDLLHGSIKSDALKDMILNGTETTWRFRRHEYTFVDENNPRFGKSTTQSMTKERAALLRLKPLLVQFRGRVNLKTPDCDIYLLEGLSDKRGHISMPEPNGLFKILARRIKDGAKHSIMGPNKRICTTNTPLCSIAAYLLCNIALMQEHDTVLDPFAGSAATLLAASLITNARTVGIDVAPDKYISRSNIREDFMSRGVAAPVALLEGNVMDHTTRDKAREAIGGNAFDVIVTDPPYGRREAMMSGKGEEYDYTAVLNDLIDVIGYDRRRGRPLLKPVGGQLTAFLPCPRGRDIQDLLPSRERLASGGLRLQEKREQKLSHGFSRWVLSFASI